MKVVITGGAGFIGLRLARRLLELGRLTAPDGSIQPIDDLVLFDVVVPSERPQGMGAPARFLAGEIADQRAVRHLIDRPDISIFHLASVVSAGGEQDFDLAMRVNLHGNLNLLEAARAQSSGPRVVFASSIAVFGGKSTPKVVDDATKQTPRTTYGMTKAIGELLVNDYTRKAFIDGRSARLPTVIIRPGKPNKAASSFVSGVFREPLNGQECVLPVRPEVIMPLAGYRTIVEGFVRLHEAEGELLGEDRAINFPSLAISVADMISGLKRVASNRHLGEIRVAPDPGIEKIVATWPTASGFERALALGLPQDPDLDSIIRAYIADYMPASG